MVKTINLLPIINFANFFRTQFFVWCDDDFQFGNETDLSYMVHVAEASGFDIIGGALNEHERSAWAKAVFKVNCWMELTYSAEESKAPLNRLSAAVRPDS